MDILDAAGVLYLTVLHGPPICQDLADHSSSRFSSLLCLHAIATCRNTYSNTLTHPLSTFSLSRTHGQITSVFPCSARPLLVPHRPPPSRLSRPPRRPRPPPILFLPRLVLGSSLRVPRARRSQPLSIPSRLSKRPLFVPQEIKSQAEAARGTGGAADAVAEAAEGVGDHAFGV